MAIALLAKLRSLHTAAIQYPYIVLTRIIAISSHTYVSRTIRLEPALTYLSQYILDTLKKHQLDPKYTMSLGYDGASVMSGHCSGVQAQVQEVAPQAIYIHCNPHCLNLALLDSVEAVCDASEFFALLETLYVFLSTAKCRSIFQQQQKELHLDQQQWQLQRLSDTCWACWHGPVSALCYTYDDPLQHCQ